MEKALKQQQRYFQLTLQLFQLLTFFTTATSLTTTHLQQRHSQTIQ
jgi:hypothetical protein